MTNAQVRVGLIGAGGNTRKRHIPGFRAIDGVELVAVSNRSRESSQRVADDFDIPQVYDDWLSLVAAPDIDAVCIGTWPYTHKPMVLAALENDKHVLTEARLALDAGEAREMLAASRAKPHLAAQVVPAPFSFRFEQTLADLIADGYLGEILSVEVAISQGFVNREAPFGWRHDRDISGYNIMLTGAWYECLMRWLGPVSSVTALSRVVVDSRTDASGERRHVDIPDHVEVLSEFPSGAVMRMRVSEVLGHAANQFWMYGTEGTLHIDMSGVRQHTGDDNDTNLYGGRRGDGDLSPIAIPAEKVHVWRVEEEFVNAIRGVEPVTRNTFETGVRYMEFTEAITRSAQTGRTVHLPLWPDAS